MKIFVLCVATVAFIAIGCDKPTSTPEASPPASPAPTAPAVPTTVNLDAAISTAKTNVETDTAALLKAQKDCINHLAANPKYARAFKDREAAAQQVRDSVRQGETSGDAYNGLVVSLNNRTQAMADIRKQILESDLALASARAKVSTDESQLESLLKQKGVQIADTPSGSLGPPPADTGDSILFPNRISGGTYIPGYYQKDGIYVPPHYQQ